MMTIEQRLDCLKAAASIMLPKLSSTEIKGTPDRYLLFF